MNLIRSAVEQPISVAVGMILALVAGVVAITRVPVQMTPTVDDTVIAVTTNWENASPQEIESEIVDKQEEKLQGLSNLRSMYSVCQLGQGGIRLEFVTGVDKEVAMRQVSDKLREVEVYPDGAHEPVVQATDPESIDYIAWFLLNTPDTEIDIQTLQDFIQDRVKPQLERVPGLSEVNVLGGREREAQIRFDPVLMAQRQITIPQFIAALRSANRNMSAGALSQGKSDVRVRAVGRFSSVRQVLDTVIRQDDSGPVYVRDVADVVETFKESQGFVRYKGKDVLAMNFQREPGSNLVTVMKALQDEVAVINAEGGVLDNFARQNGIQGGLTLIQAYDQTDYIREAFDLVESNLWFGGALATLVLLLFLRSLRPVVIIAVSIPISVIGAVVGMVVLGRSVNVISLAGMAFAVGMVVDNSIVVLENIFRHLEMGKSRVRAALDGAIEVNMAVLASTLTTLLVFVPILLVQEASGQLLRDIALAIVVSVGLSYIISITVIPCGAALLLKPIDPSAPKKERGRLGRLMNLPGLLKSVTYWFNGGLLRRVVLISVFAIVTVVGIQWTIPPIDYLPAGNRNLVFGVVLTPPGYSMEQMRSMGERVEANIRPFWETTDTGDTSALYQVPTGYMPDDPLITPPGLKHYFLVARNGALFHGGISNEPRRVADLVPLFQAATSQQTLPDCYGFAFQFPLFRIGGRSGGAVKIDFVGADLDEVTGATLAMMGTLMGEFGPTSTRPDPTNFNLGTPELQFVPDLDRMSDLGMTMDDLGLAVQACSDGVPIGDYDLNGDIIDLKLISNESVGHGTLNSISDAKTAVPGGGVVSLGTISRQEWTTAPETIKRVNRQRAITLEFTPPADLPLQQAIEKINENVANLRAAGVIAPGVNVQLAGSAGRLTEMKRALLGDGSLLGTGTSAMFLSLVVVYLLMCVLFQSWLYPFVIMFTVPLATLGGFIGLGLVHFWSVVDRYMPVQNMDVMTILGFVILAGVVVNNAILIVAQTLTFLKEGVDGKPIEAREAISLAVESRVRPIFMSMLTSVGGMLPLVLMPGSGSELYRGLGAVVVGGLVVSTVFTLVLVPALLGFVFHVRAGLAGALGVTVGESTPPAGGGNATV